MPVGAIKLPDDQVPWFVKKITYSDLRHLWVSLARSLQSLELPDPPASPEPACHCEA